MNMHEFEQNRRRFPPEELLKYAGKYIAWSPDGRTIVASHDDPLQLEAAVRTAGYDPAECVISCVPLPDEVILGGGAFSE